MIDRQKISHFSLSYIAGLFDGEGYLGISRDKKIHSKRGLLFRVYGGLRIREKFIVKAFAKRFGGTVCKRIAQNPNWADTYVWQIYGCDLEKFLKTVASYLILKQPQARIILRCRQLTKTNTHTRIMPKCKYIAYQNLTKQINKLNFRGKKTNQKKSEGSLSRNNTKPL